MSGRNGAAEGSVVITHAVGLHARPSVKLTKLAKTFASAIALRAGDGADWTDAKSIVKVMKLKIREGSTIHFRAEGDDADAALSAVIGLVRSDFADDA